MKYSNKKLLADLKKQLAIPAAIALSLGLVLSFILIIVCGLKYL